MPYKLKNPVRHKFTKRHYNERDWKSYDANLIERGSINLWISKGAISSWEPSAMKIKRRGGQQKYSSLSIETAHTLRLVYNLGLRQTEGFLSSIMSLMKLNLSIPDHTTLSRRGETLPIKKGSFSMSNKVIIIDSTGVKVLGEKEWMNCKHGTRQRKVWRKLHICINGKGKIVSSSLTNHTTSDTSQVETLLSQIDSEIDTFIGDGGYDFESTYSAIEKHEQQYDHKMQVIIPPNTGFQKARSSDASARLNNIQIISNKGKLAWQNQMDFGRRSKVENIMHRYKAIIGNKLKSKSFANQVMETKLGVKILNKMLELGRSDAKIPT